MKITKIKIKSAPDGIPTGVTHHQTDLGPYEENVLDLADELIECREKERKDLLGRVLDIDRLVRLVEEVGVKVGSFLGLEEREEDEDLFS